MGMIRTINVVARSGRVWVYGDPVGTIDPESDATITWQYAAEPLAVFDSMADLFSAWDVESEPTLDVHVYFEGESPPWAQSRSEDPEHKMDAPSRSSTRVDGSES